MPDSRRTQTTTLTEIHSNPRSYNRKKPARSEARLFIRCKETTMTYAYTAPLGAFFRQPGGQA
jgi:hypothetical protein